MSLQANDDFSIPAETVHVARLSLPKGNVYLRMRDELGVWCHDGDFADLFSRRGQPAEAPWRLALVTIMQFAEGLTDRQAAEAVANAHRLEVCAGVGVDRAELRLLDPERISRPAPARPGRTAAAGCHVASFPRTGPAPWAGPPAQ